MAGISCDARCIERNVVNGVLRKLIDSNVKNNDLMKIVVLFV